MRRDKLGWLIAAFGIVAALMIARGTAVQKNNAKAHRSDVTPFRIAGNFYYVGREDVSVFLVTSPQGHVRIDGGYPDSPSLIVRSIEELVAEALDLIPAEFTRMWILPNSSPTVATVWFTAAGSVTSRA